MSRNALLSLPEMPRLPSNAWKEQGWNTEDRPGVPCRIAPSSEICSLSFARGKALLSRMRDGVRVWAVGEWSPSSAGVTVCADEAEAVSRYEAIEVRDLKDMD